ncbi:TonB-dependent receptor [Frigoriflavimonas asaccharolytica]|uniref:Iron complex outermembrane receptor protein n=1 Tax=Frigoriflavimonas asaccharolytica TaxID=2735899 RepID=A0A8J8G7R3_9FLAO|nr:TonB-dependent receptor plug domain-containing protein [Frigoriflavimonas asaccharolytica]NRS92225.1 iron complex outermembrane receptor protein [Frigoriflavimonas asaccharolytica]
MKGFIILGLAISPFSFAQQSQDTLKTQDIESVVFTKKLPIAKEIISVEKDLSRKNLGQDLPILLKNQTSIVSTSDAGNGVGYTGFRIRGVSGTAINLMLNGVPYNDSESQGTFFVNVPDLTSSASQIVIQRGVGTSSNGVAAFGASVNIISKKPEEKFYVKSDNSFGSFNTFKNSAEIGSGKFLNNKLSLMGRYTRIQSDGFIDRASSNLNSYNIAALFEEKNTEIRFLAFGGKEKTYQAWNGIDAETYKNDPKFNISGAIYDQNFENIVDFYDNETDNYRQNHYQLLWNQKLKNNWNLETTLHFTKGKGFYENYKQSAKFSKYNLANVGTSSRTDFIRKKWLDNDFYGVISTLSGGFKDVDFNVGIVANQYDGKHFGNVTGVFLPEINEHEYYRNNSVKKEFSSFAKALYKVDQFEFFGDLQLRNINYDTNVVMEGDDEGANLSNSWLFFNPKVGFNYKIPSGKLYFSYAQANREPNRDDLLSNPETKSERLHDFEAGVEKSIGIYQFSSNLYFMNYKNQLVLNGEINNVGEFIRINSGNSYRAGIEFSAQANLSARWMLSGNATFSKNRNKDFNIENASGINNLGDTPISFSPEVISNVLVQFNPTKKLSLFIQNQFIGSQFLDNTDNEKLKLESYFLSDFNAVYHLDLKRVGVDFNLLLNNIFDKQYVNNGFVYDVNPYYYSQAGFNFMAGFSIILK